MFKLKNDSLSVATIIAIGFMTGVVNGFLGVGGGTFLIPALVFGLKVPEHLAHGSTVATILPTSIVSTIVYASNRLLDVNLATKVALGGMVGAYIGARLMNRLSPTTLRRIFAIFIFIAGLRMLIARG